MAYCLAVRPGSGERTWTVVDASYATVGPVEEWLEAHRCLWSPNTVRGYATSLAQWWSFLEQRGEAGQWAEAGVPAVAGFLSWLRNGRTVERSLAVPAGVPSAETLHARLAALISFYQWQAAAHDVPVAGRLMRGQPTRAPSRGLLAHLDSRRGTASSSLVKVHRRRDRPPLLLPQDIQAIIDGCASWDSTAGDWAGNLRDRLIFSVLAETGDFSRGAKRTCGVFSCFGCSEPWVVSPWVRQVWWNSERGACGLDGLVGRGASAPACGGVDLGHELAVGCAGCGELVAAFFELEAEVGGLLFEMGDLLAEGVDVGGGAEPGFLPGLLAESFGEPFLELLDAGAEAGRAFVGGEQVGLQG